MSGRERIYLYDTTLRDGAQTSGIDFSVEDKKAIAQALDRLGIDYIEGGWPGANPGDTSFFANPPQLTHAKLSAFGMTRRAGRSASNDPGLQAVLDVSAPVVCLVGKTWDFHVRLALGISEEENLSLIADSIRACRERNKEVLFDAEHFFDGYKAHAEHALACVRTAYEAGARWVVLCDTNGGSQPAEIRRIVSDVTAHVPGDRLGIHCHNDTEQAVANSLAAVEAGVRQIQGTINGLGERCGNANLCTILPTLMLKEEYADRFETGVNEDGLKLLTSTSRLLDELLNRAPNRHQPYVGASAFAHKGGLHVSAVLKDPRSYEHVNPEAVGNERHILVSDQAGRSNILARLAEVGIDLDAKDPRVDKLLSAVKEQEFKGYSYDGADASFELMARRVLGQVPEYFRVERFRVLVERRYNAKGVLVSVSEATVKAQVDDQEYLSVAEGTGPVNALDLALRKDLGKYSRYIEGLRLVDFKVRIFDGGTDAVTRVLIESCDENGRRWFTVGVSANIVDASFVALLDSLNYKLYIDKAPAGNLPKPAR